MDPRGPFLHSKVLLPDLREQLDRLLTPRSDVELRDSVSPRGLPSLIISVFLEWFYFDE